MRGVAVSGTQANSIVQAVRAALQAQDMVATKTIRELEAKLDQLVQETPRGRR